MSADHRISEIYDSRVGDAVLRGNDTTLLDYEH